MAGKIIQARGIRGRLIDEHERLFAEGTLP
jgi:hypothetical protein